MSQRRQLSHDDQVVINPTFKANAPAQYARLRKMGPIHSAQFDLGLTGWLVVGHDLAKEALTHPALAKDSRLASEALTAAGYVLHDPAVGFGRQMLAVDPPDHTRLRRLVSAAFTPRRTALLAPRIEQIANDLIDAMPPAGELDLVESFNSPLPVTVIAELLGVPEDHRNDFRRWSSHALQLASPQHRTALAGLHELLGELIVRKRSTPEDDLLSALVAARDEDDGRLSEEELLGTAMLLVVAGHETTVNLLGNAFLALLLHPEQLHILRDEPELTAGAVEEFLRFDTSVEHATNRYAAEDLMLGGVSIPQGSVVVVALSSATHDTPQADGGAPTVLDVTRPNARHMSFGHGIHYCLGAPLARLEATIALRTLLSRLPELALAAPTDSLTWIGSGFMRGLLSLPVRYRKG
ncbi:cytochrome P450 [Streptomyces sp. NPDC051362]|uniref:cytochrome P450 n=1 Tax=Streptomyces sp. NPDC051362 TaxID=3365651 RepID=UPI0037AF0CAC